MFDIFSLLIGFIPLFWGANLLVDSSTRLVQRTRVTNFFVGLTVVAFGTSSPEMTVNVMAAIKHDNFITTGNILGSNVFNISFILATVALVSTLIIKTRAVRIETISVFIIAIVLLFISNDKKIFNSDFNVISRWEGAALLGMFLIFLIVLMRVVVKKDPSEQIDHSISKAREVIKLLMGLGLLIAGAQLIIYSAQNLADYLNISERIVALVFISIGTSLPELATAIIAIRKGNTEIIFGNLVGSTVFNGLFVLGVSALIYPIRVNAGIQQDLMVHLIVSALLLAFLLTPLVKKVNGGLLLLIYFSYIFYLFVGYH